MNVFNFINQSLFLIFIPWGGGGGGGGEGGGRRP